jgi:hypothetical protein
MKILRRRLDASPKDETDSGEDAKHVWCKDCYRRSSSGEGCIRHKSCLDWAHEDYVGIEGCCVEFRKSHTCLSYVYDIVGYLRLILCE